jgi:hypothetical protein
LFFEFGAFFLEFPSQMRGILLTPDFRVCEKPALFISLLASIVRALLFNDRPELDIPERLVG